MTGPSTSPGTHLHGEHKGQKTAWTGLSTFLSGFRGRRGSHTKSLDQSSAAQGGAQVDPGTKFAGSQTLAVARAVHSDNVDWISGTLTSTSTDQDHLAQTNNNSMRAVIRSTVAAHQKGDLSIAEEDAEEYTPDLSMIYGRRNYADMYSNKDPRHGNSHVPPSTPLARIPVVSPDARHEEVPERKYADDDDNDDVVQYKQEDAAQADKGTRI